MNREALWNAVEASELRKDSQLARLIEVGLPIGFPAMNGSPWCATMSRRSSWRRE